LRLSRSVGVRVFFTACRAPIQGVRRAKQPKRHTFGGLVGQHPGLPGVGGCPLHLLARAARSHGRLTELIAPPRRLSRAIRRLAGPSARALRGLGGAA
jgi:hypothetical protein